MADAQDQGALRREVLALKDDLLVLADRLAPIDSEAVLAVLRARSAMFEAWTILCTPPGEDEDDDH